MNSKLQSALRHLLMAIGAFLIGHNFLGNVIDESFLQESIGIVLSIFAFGWSLYEKNSTIETAQAVARQSLTFIGGLLVASGKLSAEALQMFLGSITIVVPFIYSVLSRQKNRVVLDDPDRIIAKLKR